MPPTTPARVDLFLVCSSGGHLLQLHALRDVWIDRSRIWITTDAVDSRSILSAETAIIGDPPSSRSIMSLIRNTMFAWRYLRRHRPKVILSTGSGIAVPYAWLGRLFGARVIYVESLTRIDRPSLTLRLIRRVATRVYVQWPELAAEVAGARFVGTVFGAP